MPLLVKVFAAFPSVIVPLTVPVAVAASVIFGLLLNVPLNVKVFDAATLKVVLIVIVFPFAADAKVQVPLIVRLFNVIVGTAVILAD
jgi:hypothetical protein